MKSIQSEMEAVVMTAPSMQTVLNPETLNEDPHLCYEAEIQYKTKPPVTRLIMCSSLDVVEPGGTVMLTYHSGMRCYKHSRHVIVSNVNNCIGGFYYTNGQSAE